MFDEGTRAAVSCGATTAQTAALQAAQNTRRSYTYSRTAASEPSSIARRRVTLKFNLYCRLQ